MSKITKDEWKIISAALGYWYAETFEQDENAFTNAFPDMNLHNEKDFDKAQNIFNKLDAKVWSKINGN